jgi:SprT protein
LAPDRPNLSESQRNQVVAKALDDIHRAALHLDITLASISVKFDLTGGTAGMYCRRGARRWLRFNPHIFATDFEHHVSDTVVHEVCHYAIEMSYYNAKSHGKEWRELMMMMGGNPSATYRLTPEQASLVRVRRQRRHPYHCGCRPHYISSTRHNRISCGRAQYACCYCHRTLRYTPAATTTVIDNQ